MQQTSSMSDVDTHLMALILVTAGKIARRIPVDTWCYQPRCPIQFAHMASWLGIPQRRPAYLWIHRGLQHIPLSAAGCTARTPHAHTRTLLPLCARYTFCASRSHARAAHGRAVTLRAPATAHTPALHAHTCLTTLAPHAHCSTLLHAPRRGIVW